MDIIGRAIFGSTHETKRSAMQVILNRRFDVSTVGVHILWKRLNWREKLTEEIPAVAPQILYAEAGKCRLDWIGDSGLWILGVEVVYWSRGVELIVDM